MGLSTAHMGYEYQDLLSAFFIINELIEGEDAEFLIDRKEVENDKFDDLTIKSKNRIVKRQIKYSENKKLEKSDLSTGSYDLALDTLFISWKEYNNTQNIEPRILLAWDYDNDLDFLYNVDAINNYGNEAIQFLKVDIDKIWKVGEKPLRTWKRLRDNSDNIDRKEFAVFLENLIIEVDLPKASLDIMNKGEMERLAVDGLRRFGVGIYPNHESTAEDILLRLLNIIKNSRSHSTPLNTTKIIALLGLINGFGAIEQEFFVDHNTNIIEEKKHIEFLTYIRQQSKVTLIGEPGAGKSWFITNFIDFLKVNKLNVIRHYCYTELDDSYYINRISINTFLANLIDDIIGCYPILKDIKKTKYGVNAEELQYLLDAINEETIIIIDGLDHIGRIQYSHNESIGENETGIIKLISELNTSDNIKIVLASQPIQNVIDLESVGYSLFELEKWGRFEVKELMNKNGIDEIKSFENGNISDALLSKSDGNPLYLTYLLNELNKITHQLHCVEVISFFPEYDVNLKSYYDYLMKRLDEDHAVVFALAGATFYLNVPELKEITRCGDYVEKRIKLIHSILRENTGNGGFIIYHESFRRYILELLEDNGLSIFDNVYKDIIVWLTRSGLYENQKAYMNLFKLLYESKKYDSIQNYIDISFMENSVYYGYSVNAIRNNIEYMIKATCKKRDFGKVILLSELSNILGNYEYYFEFFEPLYSKNIGLVHGFEWLSSMLIYEGKMTYPLKNGLSVCYSCSLHNVVPRWDLYIRKMRSEKNNRENLSHDEKFEEFKFLVCASIDTGRDITKMIEDLSDEGYRDYQDVIINEFKRRKTLVDLLDILDKLPINTYWMLAVSEDEVIELNENKIKDLLKKIEDADSIYGEVETAVNDYCLYISILINDYSEIVEEFLNRIKDRSWFYNWLIYVAKINKVLESDHIDEEGFTEAFNTLNKNTKENYNGIRTMDLYGIRNLVYSSIKEPLLVNVPNNLWRWLIDVLSDVSSETMVTFQGAMMGPLTTDRLFELMNEIVNDDNYNLILCKFQEITDEEKTRRFYTNLADYSMKRMILLFNGNQVDEAKNEFRSAVKYLLSYGERRDRSLSRLMDSVESTYLVDPIEGIGNIKRLRSLAEAVVRQTDGKETSRYVSEWLDLLLQNDPLLALKYIVKESDYYVKSWILEDGIESILVDGKSDQDVLVRNLLFKTQPDKSSDGYISSYIDNVKKLINEGDKTQARNSIPDVLNKFQYNENRYEMSKEIENELRMLCKEIGIQYEWLSKEPMTRLNNTTSSSVEETEKTESIPFEFNGKYDEVIANLTTYGFHECNNSIYVKVLESITELNQENRNFINALVDYCFSEATSNGFTKLQKEFANIYEIANITTEVYAYISVRTYLVHKDGWYNKFTKPELFINAYKADKETTLTWFFEYLANHSKPSHLIEGSSGRLINTLAQIDDYTHEVQYNWNTVYTIIDYRLSCREEYDWTENLSEFDDYTEKEMLNALLLSRLRYGVAGRQKYIFTGLEDLLKDNRERLSFVKPFKRMLKHYNENIEYSVFAVLFLVAKHYTEQEIEEYEFGKSIDESVNMMDYKGNILIEYLMAGEIRGKDNSLTCNDELTDIDKYLVDYYKSVDRRIDKLGQIGVNVESSIVEFQNKIFEQENMKRMSDLIFDENSSLLLSNVYCYSDLTMMLGKECKKFINEIEGFSPKHTEHLRSQFSDEAFNILVEDQELNDALTNSVISRPTDLKLPSCLNVGLCDIRDDGWVRLAYIEREYKYKEEYIRSRKIGENCEINQVIMAIGFGDNTRLPVYSIDPNDRVFDRNVPEFNFRAVSLKNITAVVYSNNSREFEPFLTYNNNDYLGLTDEVLDVLRIRMISNEYGLVGIDDKENIVLVYQRWENYTYITGGGDERTPLLVGSQLKMSSNKYQEMLAHIKGDPYCYLSKKKLL